MNTGSQQFGRPSFGAWATYGLGSESRDLPGFVVLNSGTQGNQRRQLELGQRLPADGLQRRAVPQQRRSGAVSLESARHRRDRRSATRSTPSSSSNQQRLDADRRSRNRHAHQFVRDGLSHADQRAGADGSLERAENDSRHVRRRAGQAVVRQQLPAGPAAARARRALRAAVPRSLGPARQSDERPEEELQRLPISASRRLGQGSEAARAARRHARHLGRRIRPHADGPRAATTAATIIRTPSRMWMAGGGIKPGLTLGQTDEFGFNVVEDRVHVHDLHATLLHLLGFDHTKLTYRFQGRDFRLTDVQRHGRQKAAGLRTARETSSVFPQSLLALPL